MNLSLLNRFSLLAGKHRNASTNQALGRILAFTAGFINAGGFFIVQQYTSHMTGIASIAADNIALGQYLTSLLMLGYIGCFIFGSTVTTLIVISARKQLLHAQYALPLLLEALCLLLITLAHTRFHHQPFTIPFVIAALCFLMGLQNALITKISSSIIRTTHITGMTTDLGIELGRAILSKTSKSSQINQNKARLHLSLISIFFAGGIVGALTLEHIQAYGLLPIALLLTAISLPPLMQDINIHRRLKTRHTAWQRS